MKTMLLIEPEQLKKILSEILDEKILKLTSIASSSKPDSPPKEFELVKVDTISKICKYKKNYIYELVRKKKIPVHRIGHSIRFNPAEIQLWIKAGRPSIIELGITQLSKVIP